PYAVDERAREFTQTQGTDEAAERGRTHDLGGGGGKGSGQGERRPAKHAPDSVPGSRAQCAGMRAPNRKTRQGREVHGALAPHHDRTTAVGLHGNQQEGRHGRGRGDMGAVRGEPGSEPSGPSSTAAQRSVSSETLA